MSWHRCGRAASLYVLIAFVLIATSQLVAGQRASAATTPRFLIAADSEYVDLYHGTTRTGAAGIRVNGIDLSLANPRTDFGPGFYTTRSLEQAAARAEAVGGPEGEILHYRVPTAAFDNLSGLTFESGGDAYASFLRGIREGDMHGFDYVEGPFLRNPGDFYAGKDAITTGNQVSFHTPSAVELLNGYLLP